MLILISETVESVEQGSELSFHGDWPASCLSVAGVFVTLCVNSLSNSSHRLREQITLLTRLLTQAQVPLRESLLSFTKFCNC